MRGFQIGIWLFLLVLLGLNIGGSFLDLGPLNPPLTLALAAAQAVLILAFCMGLRKAAPVLRITAGAGFFWLLLMLGLTFSDYRTRPEDITLNRSLPESAWERLPAP